MVDLVQAAHAAAHNAGAAQKTETGLTYGAVQDIFAKAAEKVLDRLSKGKKALEAERRKRNAMEALEAAVARVRRGLPTLEKATPPTALVPGAPGTSAVGASTGTSAPATGATKVTPVAGALVSQKTSEKLAKEKTILKRTLTNLAKKLSRNATNGSANRTTANTTKHKPTKQEYAMAAKLRKMLQKLGEPNASNATGNAMTTGAKFVTPVALSSAAAPGMTAGHTMLTRSSNPALAEGKKSFARLRATWPVFPLVVTATIMFGDITLYLGLNSLARCRS